MKRLMLLSVLSLFSAASVYGVKGYKDYVTNNLPKDPVAVFNEQPATTNLLGINLLPGQRQQLTQRQGSAMFVRALPYWSPHASTPDLRRGIELFKGTFPVPWNSDREFSVEIEQTEGQLPRVILKRTK